jgi:8-oxo-dGTP pyrophosphatase MutT (NUDIX family)
VLARQAFEQRGIDWLHRARETSMACARDAPHGAAAQPRTLPELHPEDRVRADHVRQFVRASPDCFERSNLEGHVTGSAWIVSADRRSFLLTHHRKLGRWLQLGGHADGDPDPLRVALREAREESGLRELVPAHPAGEAMPLDVDVHLIPAREGEPAHLHHDVRYLFVAAPGQTLVTSAESEALRWFPVDSAERLLEEESLLRMARRARALLSTR